MLALILAADATAISPAEVAAASGRIQANGALMASLVDHGRPVIVCSLRAMAVSRPGDPSGGASHDRAAAKRLRAKWSKCGFDREARFWAKSIRVQFPEFGDDMAQAVSQAVLSGIIFDSISDNH
jgi:hypothetical protein